MDRRPLCTQSRPRAFALGKCPHEWTAGDVQAITEPCKRLPSDLFQRRRDKLSSAIIVSFTNAQEGIYLCIPIGIWTIFFCLKTCHWLHPCEIVERSIKYFQQLDTRHPPKLYIHSRRSGRTMFGPSLAVTTTPRTRVGTQDRWRHLVRGSRCRGAKEGRRARSPCPGQEPATNNTRLGQFHFFLKTWHMWILVAHTMF